MSELAEVHRALADQVRANVAREFNVAPWPFSQMALPRIEVWPSDEYLAYYAESYSDTGVMNVAVRLRIDISTQDAETAFLQMTDLLSWDGPSSLRTAVMTDRSLGGVVDSATVLTAEWETDEENQAQTAWVPVDLLLQK